MITQPTGDRIGPVDLVSQIPEGRSKMQGKSTTGFTWGLDGQLQRPGPCLPAGEKLAPRRRADGLDIIILQLDTFGGQPVQRRGLDI